jgi:hypothetical protein
MACADIQIVGHCVECRFYHEVPLLDDDQTPIIDTECKNPYSEFHGREVDLTDTCDYFGYKGRF